MNGRARSDDLRRAALVLALALLGRLLLAALVPLVPDETYYWEWSRRLAPGYFDHPPAIAALIRLGVAVAGNTPLGVRLFPVLAGIVAIGAAAALARELAGDRAALWTAVIGSVLPLSALGLVLATPDAPLLCFSALALLAVVRATRAVPRRPAALGWWLAAGLMLGAAMLSKLTALVLPLGIAIGLAATPRLRRVLATPEPYLGTLLAVASFSPTLLWNARHGWVAFAFQLRHGFAGAAEPVGPRLARELALVAGQAGLVSPVLFVLCAIACAAAVAGGRRAADPRLALLGIVSACLAAVFVRSAWVRAVEPNWPAPAYLPALALVGGRAAAPGARRWRAWAAGGAALAGATTLLLAVHTLVPFLPLRAGRDPTARGAGWAPVAARVERVVIAASGSPVRVHIAANRYQDASELAFHLPGHPPVLALNIGSRRNQYSLWPGFPDDARPGDDLVVLTGRTERLDAVPAEIAAIAGQFDSATRADTVSLRRGKEVVATRAVWLLSGWHGPEPLRPRAGP